MKKLLCAIACLSSLCFACASDNVVQYPEYERDSNYRDISLDDEQNWADSINNFGTNLYNRIATENNSIFSPFSMYTTLSQVSYGAADETLDEMQATLHLNSDKAAAAKLNADMIYNLKLDGSRENSELRIASRLLVGSNLNMTEDFSKTMEDLYESPVELVDLTNKGQVVHDINQWVYKETYGNIDNIISEDDIQHDTKIIMLNALYFNAKWHNRFEENDTTVQTFYQLDGNTSNIQMMHQQARLKLLRNSDYDALTLPYSENKFSMIVILPHENDGIKELTITEQELRNIMNNATECNVWVNLPKFRIEAEYSNETLMNQIMEMGMVRAFESDPSSEKSAQFSNLSPKYTWIGSIVQKAVVEVNEAGTEAAAITRETTSCLFCDDAGEPTWSFVADHPFNYYIVHTDSGAVLFSGQFYNN